MRQTFYSKIYSFAHFSRFSLITKRLISEVGLRRTMEAHQVVKDVIDNVPLHVVEVNYSCLSSITV